MTLRIIFIILGWFCFVLISPSWAKTRVDFEGQINFDQNELNLSFYLPVAQESSVSEKQDPSNPVVVKIAKIDDTHYRMSVKLDHVKALSYDFSSEFTTNFEIIKNDNSKKLSVLGQLQSQYAMVDSKPIRELSADFKITDHQCELTSATFGNVKGSGSVELKAPFKLDLFFHLNEIEMPDFLRFWMADNQYSSSGNVSGVIRVSGALNKVYLKGNLESYNGFVEKLQYDTFLLNTDGAFPNMQIANSTISQLDGLVFTLDGPINLSDRENFTKQVAALTFSPIVDDSEQKRAWTIKRLKDEGVATTEIKYFLRKDNIHPSSTDNDSDMLGIERSLEF